MSEVCPASGELVGIELGRIATQYREAEKWIAYMSTALGQVEEAAIRACAIPSFFDIETAVGDQLTLIGKRLGFPRCHCICTPQPVYGFDCGGPWPMAIAGPCDDAVWAGCDSYDNGTICINNDDDYRAHLMSRRYQMLGLYDDDSLTSAVQHVWGATAKHLTLRVGSIVVAPGRLLTTDETTRLQVSLRVLPVAPGVKIEIATGAANFVGFGTGWAGSCDDGVWLCAAPIDPYACL